jgi:hypothetical protein
MQASKLDAKAADAQIYLFGRGLDIDESELKWDHVEKTFKAWTGGRVPYFEPFTTYRKTIVFDIPAVAALELASYRVGGAFRLVWPEEYEPTEHAGFLTADDPDRFLADSEEYEDAEDKLFEASGNVFNRVAEKGGNCAQAVQLLPLNVRVKAMWSVSPWDVVRTRLRLAEMNQVHPETEEAVEEALSLMTEDAPLACQAIERSL